MWNVWLSLFLTFPSFFVVKTIRLWCTYDLWCISLYELLWNIILMYIMFWMYTQFYQFLSDNWRFLIKNNIKWNLNNYNCVVCVFLECLWMWYYCRFCIHSQTPIPSVNMVPCDYIVTGQWQCGHHCQLPAARWLHCHLQLSHRSADS